MSRTLDQFIARYFEPADGSHLTIPPAKLYLGFVMSGLFDPPTPPDSFQYQDAWSNGYREVYVDRAARACYTYCEGDLDLAIDDTDGAFTARLYSAAGFYARMAA